MFFPKSNSLIVDMVLNENFIVTPWFVYAIMKSSRYVSRLFNYTLERKSVYLPD